MIVDDRYTTLHQAVLYLALFEGYYYPSPRTIWNILQETVRRWYGAIPAGEEQDAATTKRRTIMDKELSPAQRLVSDVAPKLAELTDDVLFGDIWERPGLAKRDRSLITVATLVAL